MFGTFRDRAMGASREVVRRTALARQPRPEGVSGPPLKLLLAELGALAGRGLPREVPHHIAHNPQPVMLLPGFGAHPGRMRRMELALCAAGHEAQDWGMGFNFGPTEENFVFLMRRVGALARHYGEPVALVGWSLGGLFAREIAHRQPDSVSRVITMGTPFSGDRRANNAWRAYQLITGHTVDAPPIECEPSKPPVPTIALWSPRDGVVAPRSACGWPSERDRAVAVRCNHLGFANDPRVIAEVLRQLDMDH
ncbi:esterase/lipase family protein [Novosphingobium sp. JCM 18896]|uniref:esterase/lipase family protein n=1 Tax=Novosphingobium sp. JCM 18896 TaxID=2989731 RepID=UPI0022226154|nr:alpha/beta hydrolase [Novosphingobium sp. JCM 18896]MCW1428800.1 alpha/beta hydrolase [Novosphingobium sp. JCM 18896]